VEPHHRHIYMFKEESDRRTLRELAVEIIEGKVVLAEVLDATMEEARAKCGKAVLGDCLSGVLVVSTQQAGIVHTLSPLRVVPARNTKGRLRCSCITFGQHKRYTVRHAVDNTRIDYA